MSTPLQPSLRRRAQSNGYGTGASYWTCRVPDEGGADKSTSARSELAVYHCLIELITARVDEYEAGFV